MARIRRFYQQVTVESAETGFLVILDGKGVRTPCRCPLVVPTEPLATAIAQEWRDQVAEVRPDHMPFTQLACSAIDRIAPARPQVIAQLLGYAQSDLLCYRAETPGDLVERQERIWQPVVDWAGIRLGAEMLLTTGVIPIAQPPSALAALRSVLDGYDEWRLAGLMAATTAMGSLLLGLAVAEGELDATQAWVASQLDEFYQMELWGDDAEAAHRRDALRDDVAAATRFLDLVQADEENQH
jgi:chaperone required for assembly of F1-ATPase